MINNRRLKQRWPKILGLCIGALVSAFIVSRSYAAECDTPLPDDIKIVPPSASVPAKLAKFVGRWGPSKWDGKLCHNLVVEEVTADGKARLIYSWGILKEWRVNKANYRRWTFDIINNKLVGKPNNRIIIYSFVGDELHGIHQIGNIISKIVLKQY